MPMGMNDRLQRRDILILGLITFLSWVGYLFVSARTAGLGFPLDDAWIHQTFARNFAGGEGWSFQNGQVSGGSTGPAWGFLLSLIHLLGFSPLWGTYLMGLGLLWTISAVSYFTTKRIFSEKTPIPLVVGGIISLEWHLVWAALSGMETILLALMIMLVFLLLLQEDPVYLVLGLLVGLSVWVRPDGLTLAGPALLAAIFQPGDRSEKIKRVSRFLIGLAILTLLYFLFNKVVAGDFWPNTFFAKQAEYSVLRQQNYVLRFAKMGLQLLIGVGALLLPGFMNQAVVAFRERDWCQVGLIAWIIGYLGIYAWRLPVVYQHGRYLMPALPLFLTLAVIGWLRWLNFRSKIAWKRIISRTAIGAGTATLLVFWFLGARAYARDVGVIQTEMVQTALWIKENTPENSIIGAHDIGALGYFGERRILDLAGLVSPDVIPFIRNEDQLALYLDRNSANYLMTFPSWYPDLVEGLNLVYQGRGEFVELFDMEHIAVYSWK